MRPTIIEWSAGCWSVIWKGQRFEYRAYEVQHIAMQGDRVL